jgi:hypothetical protein
MGLTDKLTTGAPAWGVTITSTRPFTVPPEPVQDRLKLVFEVKASIVLEPEAFLLPVQPPEAVQPLVLVLAQVNVVEPL